jgi:hypothetical protein
MLLVRQSKRILVSLRGFDGRNSFCRVKESIGLFVTLPHMLRCLSPGREDINSYDVVQAQSLIGMHM